MVIDMASIGAVAGSLKAAAEMTKAMIDLRDATTFNSKVIELQGIIMSAQSSAMAAQSDQFTLLERVRELEEEMARMKKWDAEAEKYELRNFGGGTVAYILKKKAQGTEAPHWLCATCYTNKRKSFLQHTADIPRFSVFSCAACKSKATVPIRMSPESTWG